MKLYLIAGEASGDLHAGNLLKALKSRRPDLDCRAWGGDHLEAAGATVVKHFRDLAFMGFLEVAKNLRTILHNLDYCKEDILRFQPDALILVDYPGFNLRIAKWAHQQGLKTIYYIVPQLWAWHRERVHAMKRDVDKVLAILPFEPDFFRPYGLDVTFVGHPLLDALPEPRPFAEKKGLIALLPGSRKQEVLRILPPMLEATAHFPDRTFAVAGASSLPYDLYQPLLKRYPNVRFESGKTYDLLQESTAALVKSGTSTLETALLDVPEVVCYAGNPVSFQIAKRLVKVPYISLVNLILDKPLVRELIQHDLNAPNLKTALSDILLPEGRERLREGYRKLRDILGGGGASERAAREILEFVG